MPKTKFQGVIFTLMIVTVMVYAMICYNISLNIGGLTNKVFLMAFRELLIMEAIAFVLELFVVERAACFLAFQFVKSDDRPVFILLAISSMTICLMCPIMSFVATLLIKDAGKEFVSVWLQTTAMNFPMAFIWQMFFAGPLVRLIFRTIFKKSLSEVE